MSWLSDLRADVSRYEHCNRASALRVCATEQGLWALTQYRLARAVYASSLRPAVRLPLLTGLYAWRKGIEVTTGICLPHTAAIGPGTYLGHYGPIIVNNGAVIGEGCNISHLVTIGAGGHGAKAGVPVIGDHVYIATGAVVVGHITVGNRAGIGANCVVAQDIPAGAVVRPATVVVKEDVKTQTVMAQPVDAP